MAHDRGRSINRIADSTRAGSQRSPGSSMKNIVIRFVLLAVLTYATALVPQAIAQQTPEPAQPQAAVENDTAVEVERSDSEAEDTERGARSRLGRHHGDDVVFNIGSDSILR